MAFRTCPLCEATCGLQLEVEDGHVTRIRGDADDPFSQGFICPKGSTLGALHEDPDRLRRPLVRRDGAHVEVSWDEAFAEIERRLTAARERARHRRRRGVHRQPERAQLRQHARDPAARQGTRTKNVYSASTVDQMPKHVACGLVFGHPLAIPVPDIDRTDLLLLLGANPLESNGSLATAPDWPGRLEAIRRRGGRVVVVDPRRTRTAEHADLHVPIRPGTDAALLAGIACVLFAEGLADPGALADAVTGIDLVEAAVAGFTPERVASFTGVPADTVRSLARELAAAPTRGRLRPDRHPHDRVRDARRLARRRAQRPHREPRPARRRDVPPRRPRAAAAPAAGLPDGPLAQPGARPAGDAQRAARRDARGRDGDARRGAGASAADDRRQPGPDDPGRRAARRPARRARARWSASTRISTRPPATPT